MSTTAPAKTGAAPLTAPKTADVSMAKWEQPTDKKGLEALSDIVKDQLVKALPSFMANPATAQRLLRCLITECQGTPRLLECTPISLFSCCIKAGQLGLEIGGPLGGSYLLPFRNNQKGKMEAQLVVGYKGYIALAHRSGQVRRITPISVRQGDYYNVERGLDQRLEHKPKRDNLAHVTDYYVVVELVTGGKDFEEFTVAQAIDFRDKYATTRNAPDTVKKHSPWYDIQVSKDPSKEPHLTGPGFDAMAQKTLIRRIAKRTPMSAEMTWALGLEDTVERGIPQTMSLVIQDGMPAMLGDGDIETAEKAKDKTEALAEELKAAQEGKAAEEVDKLPVLILEFSEGGDLMEFLEKHGTKEGPADLGAIRNSTGAVREKWVKYFETAIAELKKAKK